LDIKTKVKRRRIDMAPSGQLAAPAVQALLQDASLAGNWTLDPAKSTVGLKTRHTWRLAPLKGVFREVSGTGAISPAGQVSGTLTVAAASIDTKNRKRDEHLRSADFFAVSEYPDITFTVDRISPAGDRVTVAGRLTVRGRTRPLSFPARVSLSGGDEVWLDGEAQINRADFGLTWNWLGIASMKNTLTVHAVFRKR
jgi:polyisoprenoid-binding protein YceI